MQSVLSFVSNEGPNKLAINPFGATIDWNFKE
jgi:hypothetical protein